ncbi:MAG: phosphopantetheine-binding protein [Propionibacteriaceae bacterium]|nr:phosphopantetheine-binding protein [Propionibacteriaceae bacterium]
MADEVLALAVKIIEGRGPESIDTLLRDLAGYNSLFIARLIDSVEDCFGVEIPAHMVVPQNFRSARSIADLIRLFKIESVESFLCHP